MLLPLVRYQASLEGIEGATIDEWKHAGLLRNGFAQRFDDTKLIQGDDGEFYDSLRGAAGVMLPVADVDVRQCTLSEAALYEQFSKRFRSLIGQPPPIALALRRQPVDKSVRIELKVAATKLSGLQAPRQARLLGPPTSKRMAATDKDLLHFDVVLEGWMPMVGGVQPAHHLFGGVRDSQVPVKLENKLFHLGTVFQYVGGYLGAYPRPGVLKYLMHDGGSDRAIDPQENLWTRKFGNASLISTRSAIIDSLGSELHEITTDRPGQAWVELKPLAETQWSHLLNAAGYRRQCESSAAASRLINSLANQLRVPPEDCKKMAERIVDGQILCPLGGEFKLTDPVDGLPVWTSTKLLPENRTIPVAAPDGYQLPLLGWYRGAAGDLQLMDDALSIDLSVDVAKSALP